MFLVHFHLSLLCCFAVPIGSLESFWLLLTIARAVNVPHWGDVKQGRRGKREVGNVLCNTYCKYTLHLTTGQLTIACEPSHKRHRHENQNRWRYIAQFEYVHRAEESNIRPSSPSHASAADGRNCFLFCSQRCDICKQVGLGGCEKFNRNLPRFFSLFSSSSF